MLHICKHWTDAAVLPRYHEQAVLHKAAVGRMPKRTDACTSCAGLFVWTSNVAVTSIVADVTSCVHMFCSPMHTIPHNPDVLLQH